MKVINNSKIYEEIDGVFWEKTEDSFSSVGLNSYISGPSNQNRAAFVKHGLKELANSEKEDEFLNSAFLEKCVDSVFKNITEKTNN